MGDEKIALPGPRRVEKLPERAGVQGAAAALQGSAPAALQSMSNRELIGQVIDSAKQLAKKEIELAKAELRADLKAEVATVKGLGVAGLCAIWAVGMMLVACGLELEPPRFDLKIPAQERAWFSRTWMPSAVFTGMSALNFLTRPQASCFPRARLS